MYKREHHRRIGAALEALDAGILLQARCFFGGGTAIALQLGEFRESRDIDFLCADQGGYRLVRERVADRGIGALLLPGSPVEVVREARLDRDAIRAVLAVDSMPIKFEIVREARIDLAGEAVPGIPVPCLFRTDLFAEKLLANADRYADKSASSRDIIDLLVMQRHWGAVPAEAWETAKAAYGESVRAAYNKGKGMLADKTYRAACFEKMDVSPEARKIVLSGIGGRPGRQEPDLER